MRQLILLRLQQLLLFKLLNRIDGLMEDYWVVIEFHDGRESIQFGIRAPSEKSAIARAETWLDHKTDLTFDEVSITASPI
jgi:hypothetical protein